jgi:nitroreductase
MRTDSWVADRRGVPHGPLHECIAAAIAAPSVHNTQPWRFRLRDDRIDVIADHARGLPVLDPEGRELLLSVGAAVFNLRVAMLARSRIPMTFLLPDPSEPDVAARITVGSPTAPPATAVMLAAAIPKRRTNRRAFRETAISTGALADLCNAAQAERARLVVVDRTARDAVLDIVRVAERRHRNNPAYHEELGRWAYRGVERRDGVPAQAFGPRDARESMPIRDFDLAEPAERRRRVDFEPEPSIAVLYTSGDTRYDWLRGGQALERTLLTAAVRGMESTLLTQPMEIPDLRALLRSPVDGYVAQAVLRFGYGPPSAPSPRRPVEEVLILDERAESPTVTGTVTLPPQAS